MMRPELTLDQIVFDCHGVCLPQASSATTDLVYSLVISELRAKVLEQIALAKVGSQRWESDFIDLLEEYIFTLETHDFLMAFRPAIAFLHLSDHQYGDVRSRALSLIRFLLGHPCLPQLTVVIPANAFGERHQLYFPHLNALVVSDGPLVVETRDNIVHCTWHDGYVSSIPMLSNEENQVAVATERVTLLAKVNGRIVLNGLIELQSIEKELNMQLEAELTKTHTATLVAGESLLQQVWPTAALANRRYLNSVLVQHSHHDHSTSVTVDRLQGCLITSVNNDIQVADAICHEGSHARLAMYLLFDPLLNNSPSELYKSPWRNDGRPLTGILNGIHAFVNVCEFYKRLAEHEGEPGRYAEQVFLTQQKKISHAFEMLAEAAKPTELGRIFLDDLETAVGGLI